MLTIDTTAATAICSLSQSRMFRVGVVVHHASLTRYVTYDTRGPALTKRRAKSCLHGSGAICTVAVAVDGSVSGASPLGSLCC